MDVKDISTIAAKFAARAAVAGPDYERGATNPRRPWAQATLAAEANYKAGVTAAAAAGRFGKGVAKAGDSKFLRGIKEKGVARFPAGVAAATGDFAAGFEPFRAALQSTTLSPRRPRRDPGNMVRVAEVCKAMIACAVGQGK